MSAILDNSRSPHRACTAVPMQSVTLDVAGFWGARLRQCATTTLPRLRELMEDERVGGVLHNFAVKAGLKPGEFWGTNWQDEWLYKWLRTGITGAIRRLSVAPALAGTEGRLQSPHCLWHVIGGLKPTVRAG